MTIKQKIYYNEEPNIKDIVHIMSITNTNTYNLVYNPKVNKWELILWII